MSCSQPPIPVPQDLQEDGLTQECRDLLSSLPTEEGWLFDVYQYQGFWFPSRQIQAALACQQHFQAQGTDILLVTTPKSGTTWLKAMVFALVNRAKFPDMQGHHPLLTSNPHELVPFFEFGLFLGNQIPDLSSFTAPRLFSTHLPITLLPKSVNASACKIVYLCRNPRDTFVSLWHYANKYRPKELGAISLEEAFDKFCRGVSFSGPFWDHVLSYWKESLEKPQKVLFLKYEEIKAQPSIHLRRLAEFLGCPFSPEEDTRGLVDEILRLCSFDNLSNLEVNKNGKLSSGFENARFFRRGQVGDWKNHLTAEMIDRLDHVTEEKLHDSGLKFEVS